MVPPGPCRLSLAFLLCYQSFHSLALASARMAFFSHLSLMKSQGKTQKTPALLYLLQIQSNLRQNRAGCLLSSFLKWPVGVSRSFKLSDTQFNRLLPKNSQPLPCGFLQRHTHTHTYRNTKTHNYNNSNSSTQENSEFCLGGSTLA